MGAVAFRQDLDKQGRFRGALIARDRPLANLTDTDTLRETELAAPTSYESSVETELVAPASYVSPVADTQSLAMQKRTPEVDQRVQNAVLVLCQRETGEDVPLPSRRKAAVPATDAEKVAIVNEGIREFAKNTLGTEPRLEFMTALGGTP